MRYPLWAFFFILVMPPFAAHALFTGGAALVAPQPSAIQVSQTAVHYWTHVSIVR